MINTGRTLRIAAAASAVALAGGAMTTAAASAEEMPEPKTRVTFMCKAPFDGVYKTSGQSYKAGDYIFRIREEAGVPVSYTAGVGGAGLFSGSLGAYEVQYPATSSAVAGVSVKTDPGPNTYKGTASTNETQACDYVPSVPVKKDDCKDGGWEAFGFRNQGQCVASIVANENADK